MKRTLRNLSLAAMLVLAGIAATVPWVEGMAPAPPAAPPTALSGDAAEADFTLESVGGDRVSIRPLLGKQPVLVAFWATWCPYCNAAIPAMKRLHEESGKTGLRILAVDFRESREKVVAFVASRGIGYTVLLDGAGSVARRYGVSGIPTYFLFNREGKVVYRGNALPPDIRKLL